ncbi:S8 family serine peptidase [Cryomorpha ignava]|uniref:S8 family serine peptidase n=1 Tax=Cryomorpha ignava TaxID=101383 RepID=A0A7K3WV32_9FLAO|nr:S8/S53 family peptidase [Cryomorpha ignava]NEN25510.1 S8 family serine peptidase [Cryomorpha ignava]
MKTKIYSLIAAALFTLTISGSAFAQINHGARKPAKAPSGYITTDDGFIDPIRLPVRPGDNEFKINPDVPVYDQIHAPIRWYAIENERNSKYWESVNVNRIWVELEQGLTISDPAIRDFLNEYGLTEILSESKRKHQTNYWIFKLENATPEQIVEMAKAAQAIHGIRFLEPSVIYTSSYTPNDPMYNLQWGPYITYFDEAWDVSIGGNSWNVVAVIDDACDWYHEDLTDMVWYGYDYAMDDGDIYPDDPNNHKHGTHTTGTVAAKINNGIGVAGMVNDTVYFAKVGLPDGTLSDEGIVNAYYDIGDIDRITAVNMSFGGGAPSAVNEQGLNYAWNHGKILLVSSGNDGTGTISFPAAYPAAMAVGSIGTDGEQLDLASYSQYGNEQEITAPGGETQFNYGIVSCIPLNQYESMQGTSMAAPHVTGLAGLMKHVNMNLTNADIRNIINATAFDMGAPGWDATFGYGMINASLAIQTAVNGSVGIAELDGSDVMRIYPNPAADYILIDKKISFEKGTYEILDITGKMVKSIRISPEKVSTINISDLPKGVFILRMTSEIGLTATKFVKL